MQKRATIQVRLDEGLKQQAEGVFAAHGVTLAQAVRSYFEQCVSTGTVAAPAKAPAGGQHRASASGIFAAYADPAARKRERGAWEAAAVAKHGGGSHE